MTSIFQTMYFKSFNYEFFYPLWKIDVILISICVRNGLVIEYCNSGSDFVTKLTVLWDPMGINTANSFLLLWFYATKITQNKIICHYNNIAIERWVFARRNRCTEVHFVQQRIPYTELYIQGYMVWWCHTSESSK